MSIVPKLKIMTPKFALTVQAQKYLPIQFDNINLG